MGFKQSVLNVTNYIDSKAPSKITVTITTSAGAFELAEYQIVKGNQLAIIVNADPKLSMMDLLQGVSSAANDVNK